MLAFAGEHDRLIFAVWVIVDRGESDPVFSVIHLFQVKADRAAGHDLVDGAVSVKTDFNARYQVVMRAERPLRRLMHTHSFDLMA